MHKNRSPSYEQEQGAGLFFLQRIENKYLRNTVTWAVGRVVGVARGVIVRVAVALTLPTSPDM